MRRLLKMRMKPGWDEANVSWIVRVKVLEELSINFEGQDAVNELRKPIRVVTCAVCAYVNGRAVARAKTIKVSELRALHGLLYGTAKNQREVVLAREGAGRPLCEGGYGTNSQFAVSQR